MTGYYPNFSHKTISGQITEQIQIGWAVRQQVYQQCHCVALGKITSLWGSIKITVGGVTAVCFSDCLHNSHGMFVRESDEAGDRLFTALPRIVWTWMLFNYVHSGEWKTCHHNSELKWEVQMWWKRFLDAITLWDPWSILSNAMTTPSQFPCADVSGIFFCLGAKTYTEKVINKLWMLDEKYDCIYVHQKVEEMDWDSSPNFSISYVPAQDFTNI